MNDLSEIIRKEFPGARLFCRECGNNNVHARENCDVTLNNPLAERMLSISCVNCGLSDETIREDEVRSTVKAWLVESVRRYICSYEHKNMDCVAETSGALSDFKDGFWINHAGKYAEAGDRGAIWIPPGRINYVEAIVVERRLSE